MDTNLLETSNRKSRDLESLKRVGNFLVSLWEIPSILAGLSDGQSLIISKDGRLSKGKVDHKKLTELGSRLVGKSDGHFDIGNYFSGDFSMLENQELILKHSIHHTSSFETGKLPSSKAREISLPILGKVTEITLKNKVNPLVEVFLSAWKFQENNHPENVEISREISPKGHRYLIVKIKQLNFRVKVAELTGKAMYIVYDDGTQISL